MIISDTVLHVWQQYPDKVERRQENGFRKAKTDVGNWGNHASPI